MNEVEWLDKVKHNFSEEQFFKDMARYEESGTYILSDGSTWTRRDADIANNQLSTTIAGRVQMAEEMVSSGLVTSPDQYFNILNDVPQTVVTQSGNTYYVNGAYAGEVIVSNGNDMVSAQLSSGEMYNPVTGEWVRR